ncbi:MBL fold metallo-hydrolase [Frondihabitans sucicola]|uniref:MBL fold metallo-hydrolase n=1 Tax=Frondihabitans sucicola TaxID=1268041 RepID=A0ABN6Y5G8_9MICO|nr:MBL fold metallo-hydrolase [Frondihabitans sucicola]BDZ51226.1 MBL fold metallo-hydrolase [Frondihabitans sucicola]
MRVTKYEHAALVVEEAGHTLVVDPGSFTRPLGDTAHVDAVVVTHAHPDHWTPVQLAALRAANPDVPIFGPAGVVEALAGENITATTITDGETVEVGAFTLLFAGTTHAVIHASIPVIDNTGVLVNGTLFYPGDAFTVPAFPVAVLAAPVGAPWLKISEAMDYITAVKPGTSFPVHDQTLSAAGFAMHADRLKAATEAVGGTAVVLQPGDSLDA